MPISRPRRGSLDFGPRGAGQLDEMVRVQRVKTAVSRSQVNPEYEDIVPGGTTQNIADSTRYASVLLRGVLLRGGGGGGDVSSGPTGQEFDRVAGDVTRREYVVRMYHEPDITTTHRLVWRGVFLYVRSVDHQTERRSGGAGFSVLGCVLSGDDEVETLAGGFVAGGGTPNSTGEIGTEP